MFRLKKSLTNTTPSIEYFEGKTGEVFTYGEALILKNGKLTKCSPTERPWFVCLGSVSCKEKSEIVPVFRTFGFYVFECPIDGDTSALKIGDKVTIDDDGKGVTSTTTSGVAELTEISGDTVSVIL